MLDKDVVYLNHGSFGACPRPVFDSLLKWQRLLEKEPVKHLAVDIFKYLEKSREALSCYVNCHKDDLVFFPNPSTALNTVLRSLELNHGDEILTTNHEYGAMDRAWNFLCKKTGAKYIQHQVDLPLICEKEFINKFSTAISERTKIIFLSHITSPTALIFPVKEICEIARKKGIITIIDGAHVPGHIELNIEDINPDFYTGACHKWMCSPKGVAFLYAKKEIQNIIEPLVVSWGYESDNPTHSKFLDYLQWQGTNDVSAYLTIPDTLDFLDKNNWNKVSSLCTELNLWARKEISSQLNLSYLTKENYLAQMTTFPLNIPYNLQAQIDFYNRYLIQVPFIKWNDRAYLRISIQAYNNKQEVIYLISCLKEFLQRK